MTSEAIKWNFSSYTDNKGRTYIISYYNRWDPVKKQSRVAKRIHVGRLNSDTGEVSLSKSFWKLILIMLVSMFSMNVMP